MAVGLVAFLGFSVGAELASRRSPAALFRKKDTFGSSLALRCAALAAELLASGGVVLGQYVYAVNCRRPSESEAAQALVWRRALARALPILHTCVAGPAMAVIYVVFEVRWHGCASVYNMSKVDHGSRCFPTNISNEPCCLPVAQGLLAVPLR